MQYGLYLPNFGDHATPRNLARLAREAEDAGWDGFFLWDHLQTTDGVPVMDPWVVLAAVAASTERIRLGPLVTPIPRRRPWKLARESVTLDHLSGGRLVLGVGIGGEWWREYSAFGEPSDPAIHGVMLDEGLEVLVGLWSGEPFSFQGTYYQVDQVRFLPKPLQAPRIPIWVAGVWPHKRPLRRAARWDGVFPIGPGDGLSPLSAADVRALGDVVRSERGGASAFDIVVRGRLYGEPAEAAQGTLAEYAAAGVTWWLESLSHRTPFDDLRAQVAAGPPRPA